MKCLYAGLAEIHEGGFQFGEEDSCLARGDSPEPGYLYAWALGQASRLLPWVLVQRPDIEHEGVIRKLVLRSEPYTLSFHLIIVFFTLFCIYKYVHLIFLDMKGASAVVVLGP